MTDLPSSLDLIEIAEQHGPLELVATNGLLGDKAVTLWAMPGETRAIETNGDSICEETVGLEEFAEALRDLGLDG